MGEVGKFITFRVKFLQDTVNQNYYNHLICHKVIQKIKNGRFF